MSEVNNTEVNILLTIPFEPDQLTRLESYSSLIQVHHYPTRDPKEIPPEIWRETEVLYTMNTLPDPEMAPNLKWIQFHLAGVEKELIHPIARQPKIKLTNLSGVNSSQVAEFILGMFLALGRNLPGMLEDKKKKIWPNHKWEKYTPLELRGSTVGIVGYGSIGRQLARLLQPFGAKILVSKANAKHPADEGYTPSGQGDPNGDFFTRLYPRQALNTMLKECDFVAVTVPKNSETKNLLTKRHFSTMKPMAFLVDVSRGGVVDPDALYTALKSGELAGAALDVFPVEPLPESDPIWELPNVIISPHVAGFSKEYNSRAIDFFIRNINNYLTETELFNLINLDKGY